MAREWWTAAALLFVMGACSAGKEDGAAGETVQTYRVRGVVVSLPRAGDASLTLRHQAVPDFVDRSGERVGMDGMTMPFPVAPGLDLEGVAAGDAVEFTLTVDWDAERPIEVTAVRELPSAPR
jgi:Cu/Ag efflux protein CusF